MNDVTVINPNVPTIQTILEKNYGTTETNKILAEEIFEHIENPSMIGPTEWSVKMHIIDHYEDEELAVAVATEILATFNI